MEYRKECPFCKKEFITKHKNTRFCSSTCAARLAGEKRRGTYKCQYCEGLIHSDHPGKRKYCSRECARLDRIKDGMLKKQAKQIEWEKEHTKICPICKKQFIANNKLAMYCSDECCYEGQLKNKREEWRANYTPRTFACAECGKLVVTECGSTRTLYCSDACMNRSMKRDYKLRRAERMQKAFIENVGMRSTFRRYKGRCGICGLPVPRTVEPSNIWAATVDHIVPLSLGGEHRKANCQLAHRICNSIKCDSPEEVQIDMRSLLKEEPSIWIERINYLIDQIEC